MFPFEPPGTQKEKVFIADILREVLSMMRGIFISYQMEVEVHSDSPLEAIPGSRQEFIRMMVILLINAIEASSPGDKIIVTMGQRNRCQYISVLDNGHGINKQDFPFLFQPFFTTKENGTGMGLCQCRGIVEKYRGNISILNRYDGQRGVEVVIKFPLKQKE